MDSSEFDDSVFDQEMVSIYDSVQNISDHEVQVEVYNIYRTDGEDLDNQYHSVKYSFSDSDDQLLEDLRSFRDESVLNWYGETVIPALIYFDNTSRMSFPIPNSGFHDSTEEKVNAKRMADNVIEELDRFLDDSETVYIDPYLMD